MSNIRRGSNLDSSELNQEEVRFVDDFSDHASEDNLSMIVDDVDDVEDDLLLDEDEDDISDDAIHHHHDFENSISDQDEDDERLGSDDLNDDGEGDLSPLRDHHITSADRRRFQEFEENAARTLREFLPSLGGNRDFSRSGGNITNLGALLGEALNGSLVDSGFGRILRQLRSQEDPVIIQGLHDLGEMLLMPHHTFGFPVLPLDAICKALVAVLKQTDTIEIQVMTARAITQLLDNGGGEDTVRSLVSAGLVPVMRQLFENVSYIDLIEQLIHVVKPVAYVEPKLVLTSGCLNPCVATLDFFNEHIQHQIMVAAESCAEAINLETLDNAKHLLAIFPEHPSILVLGTYCVLVSAIARYDNIKDLVSESMFQIMVSAIQGGTPHVSRIMRATAHVVAKAPEYVSNPELLAATVTAALVPAHETSSDIFNRLISVPKDTLFGGLKLIQVLLPVPGPIGSFSGSYRRPQNEKTPEISDLVGFSRNIAPLAIATYSATTSSQVRQLAILVVMQVVAALKKHRPEKFCQLIHELGILDFAVQIAAEGSDNLALTVGGLDIIWEMMSVPRMVQDLRNSGISGDLEQYLPEGDVQEPVGHFGPTNDLSPVSAYMTKVIMEKLNQEKGFSMDTAYEIVNNIVGGDFDIKALKKIPIANLIRADFLSALAERDVENYLCEDLVTLLQSAVTRLERFPLELTGSRATSLEDVISRVVYVRIVERGRSERAWSVTVPILATLESIEDFVRSRLTAFRSLNESLRSHGSNLNLATNGRIKFYSQNTRLPRDVSITKAIAGQSGMPVINFEISEEGEDDDDEEENELTYPSSQPIPEPLSTAFKVLRRLADENERSGEFVSWEKFRSSKLTAKLSRQLADILAVSTSMLPQWTFDTVHQYPFLYPLEVRLHFVQLTSFGMGRNLRLLRRMQQENADDDDEFPQELDESSRILGRHKRQKFRLGRENLLESALRLLEHSSRSPAIIEVMFNNEEGTGKGPTQEFFTLTSRALSDPSLQMWDFTQAGLYPRPNMNPDPTLLRYFKGMGVLVARALLDKRILDFQLNPAFFEAILSETGPSVNKVRRVDTQLADSLGKILDTVPSDINEMALDFTVPGSNDELLTGGTDIAVTAENVGDYVSLVCDRIVGSGIQQQIDAFVDGFSSTLPVSALNSFMLNELATLCGADRSEDWSTPTLKDALRFQHGYQMDSPAVKYLINTLSNFTPGERRKFLIFTTGSPHLPVGGFKALQPPLTVVVKPPDNENLTPDQYLPSVMTCVNYFKLPNYSNQDILLRQLQLAMSEGSGSFPLS